MRLVTSYAKRLFTGGSARLNMPLISNAARLNMPLISGIAARLNMPLISGVVRLNMTLISGAAKLKRETSLIIFSRCA